MAISHKVDRRGPLTQRLKAQGSIGGVWVQETGCKAVPHSCSNRCSWTQSTQVAECPQVLFCLSMLCGPPNTRLPECPQGECW
jgi:hypothetical protein